MTIAFRHELRKVSDEELLTALRETGRLAGVLRAWAATCAPVSTDAALPPDDDDDRYDRWRDARLESDWQE